MEFSAGSKGREQQIIDLFTATFTASEGEEEGALVGGLVRNLLRGTPEQDLFVFTAMEAGAIVGSACFSRLTYDQDERTVFILSPLAVATEHQGRGIGQRLVTYGLKALEAAHVDVAVTLWRSKLLFQGRPFASQRSVRRCTLRADASRRLAGTVVDRYGVSATEGFSALVRGL